MRCARSAASVGTVRGLLEQALVDQLIEQQRMRRDLIDQEIAVRGEPDQPRTRPGVVQQQREVGRARADRLQHAQQPHAASAAARATGAISCTSTGSSAARRRAPASSSRARGSCVAETRAAAARRPRSSRHRPAERLEPRQQQRRLGRRQRQLRGTADSPRLVAAEHHRAEVRARPVRAAAPVQCASSDQLSQPMLAASRSRCCGSAGNRWVCWSARICSRFSSRRRNT